MLKYSFEFIKRMFKVVAGEEKNDILIFLMRS